ncbi:hypothetical protein KR018_001527, partial [Drosophila ironensis]
KVNLTNVTFTNLKCGVSDKRFGEFEKCYIKAVNRTHKYIDVYFRLHQPPIENVTINLATMRYNNGYKPFFVNITFDGCKFLKNQRNPILKYFFDLYKDRSNLNHSCPINHDIFLDHFWTGNIEEGFLKYIPVINGDFSVDTVIYSNNILRGFLNVYLRITG